MEFVNKLREKPAVKKIEKFFPAIAFLGGFAWDSITLGQMVYGSDILILLAYYTGALILVILLSAQLEHPEGWTTERLQALAEAQAKSKQNTSSATTPPKTHAPVETAVESKFKKAAALLAEKAPAKAIEAANRAAQEAKDAAAKASAQAKDAAVKAKDAASSSPRTSATNRPPFPKTPLSCATVF